jgi:hypothetical protein
MQADAPDVSVSNELKSKAAQQPTVTYLTDSMMLHRTGQKDLDRLLLWVQFVLLIQFQFKAGKIEAPKLPCPLSLCWTTSPGGY